MSTIRVMSVFHGPGDFAQDRIVTSFYFLGAGTYAEEQETAALAVADWWNGADGQTHSLSYRISPWVQRLGELRSYDMELPKNSRVPTILPITLDAAETNGYAEEAALVLTLQGAPPVTRRRRGRIFLGPFGATRGPLAATSTLPTRPQPSLQSDACVACDRLSNHATLTWVLRSVTPTENYVGIVSGYVDDRFDTQRRRGPSTTARQTWER